MIQIAIEMYYFYYMKMVHCDLKPKNIVIMVFRRDKFKKYSTYI